MKKFLFNKTAGLLFLSFLLLLCFFFRIQLLQMAGNFLIREDNLQKADAIFILGGDSYDRGNMAVKLFNEGYSGRIVCLGENIPTIFKAMGISYTESEVTRTNIIQQFAPDTSIKGRSSEKEGIPDSAVIVLKKGTSTFEEIMAIKSYCHENYLKKIILVSSKFHTRRVRSVCKKIFQDEGPEVLIAGAPSSTYSEKEWWKSEEGLIMINNEYVKLFYYFFKY